MTTDNKSTCRLFLTLFSFLMAVMELPSRLGSASLDLYRADQAVFPCWPPGGSLLGSSCSQSEVSTAVT